MGSLQHRYWRTEVAMKKSKHAAAELVNAAILAGGKYGVQRGAGVFEPRGFGQ
ncbi:MAG: hypothetical protein MZV65_42550 [Chromatiales bacterium]|nr:hypothetical protein [Chromatiales bacterium]